jgi:flagellar hook-length control protein FliK
LEEKKPTESADSEGISGFDCGQLMSGLIAQMFTAPAAQAEGTAEGAAQETQADISITGQDVASAAVPAGLLQSEEAAPAAAILPASGEAFAAALNAPRVRENGAAGQTAEESSRGTAAPVFRPDVAGKIVETLESMSGRETSDSAPGETAAQEKEPAAADVSEGYAFAVGGTYAEAAEQTEESDLRSAAVAKALDSFLSDLNDLSAAGTEKSEIRIVLEPENLGVLTISVSRGENGISAKIRSDDRETCAAITDQIQRLIQSMESKGIRVEDVDVAFGQTESGLSFTQYGHSGSGGDTPQYYSSQAQEKTETSDRTGIFDIWQGYVDVAEEAGGAVEYRV